MTLQLDQICTPLTTPTPLVTDGSETFPSTTMGLDTTSTPGVGLPHSEQQLPIRAGFGVMQSLHCIGPQTRKGGIFQNFSQYVMQQILDLRTCFPISSNNIKETELQEYYPDSCKSLKGYPKHQQHVSNSSRSNNNCDIVVMHQLVSILLIFWGQSFLPSLNLCLTKQNKKQSLETTIQIGDFSQRHKAPNYYSDQAI